MNSEANANVQWINRRNEERTAQLPLEQIGRNPRSLMSYTNRVRGVNRFGYGNTRAKEQWVKNKSRGVKYPLNLTKTYQNTPVSMNGLYKYRNPNMAKTIRNVPKRVSPEIALENALGHRQPKLETGGRSKTRKNKKSRKNRR